MRMHRDPVESTARPIVFDGVLTHDHLAAPALRPLHCMQMVVITIGQMFKPEVKSMRWRRVDGVGRADCWSVTAGGWD